ncbi:DUF1501 domain-containing protein [Rhizosphaericola mali]|uniref:DUF1501 domain-containing protein n=1 Tax=Rhizosphaericola mali TaxID=2545455 RepID=A0A5P2GFF8_9BACT|nr:DUF1501 domain-containing protein [Rhizosphaericola mali]QES90351.1 DUF1501 domain-containing protein [Rhizosphaericola mali]
MFLKRRDFLQISSMASTALFLPKFVKAIGKNHIENLENKSVVIIQLSGGNDGLNTVIPIKNDIYHKNRPIIGFKETAVNKITDEVALHPALKGFNDLYSNGELAILNSVGYPDPDRSHFRSMDIWQTGSDSQTVLQTGWIGRYLDANHAEGLTPTKAIEVDDVLSLALKGLDQKGIAVRNPGQLYKNSQDPFYKKLLQSHEEEHHHATAEYLYKTMNETLNSANYIFKEANLGKTKNPYPNTQLGNNLKTIASLLLSDIDTRVYYVSLGSFDTHVNQQDQQNRLFGQLNDGVSAFVQDLKKNDKFKDVLIFTFTEFGRRVGQNASNGTDHGTANNMFLISGGLKKKGLINSMPDLTNLDNGDLKYQVDFKEVYATILNNWLGADDRKILGTQYKYLDFV